MKFDYKHIFKQLFSFIGFSGIGWIIDFTTYSILSMLKVNLFFCNVCSSILGATFVFIFSTRFVFENGKTLSVRVKYAIYIVYQLILIFAVSKIIVRINGFILNNFDVAFITKYSALISKVVVTPFTMTLNFIVMKNVLEKL